jgi:hypothetical protein
MGWKVQTHRPIPQVQRAGKRGRGGSHKRRNRNGGVGQRESSTSRKITQMMLVVVVIGGKGEVMDEANLLNIVSIRGDIGVQATIREKLSGLSPKSTTRDT